MILRRIIHRSKGNLYPYPHYRLQVSSFSCSSVHHHPHTVYSYYHSSVNRWLMHYRTFTSFLSSSLPYIPLSKRTYSHPTVGGILVPRYSSSSSSSSSPSPPPVPDDIHDPVRLAISILQRHGGAMHPSALMKAMYNIVYTTSSLQDEDQVRKSILRTEGNGITFAKHYPHIFTIDWEIRRCGDTSVMEYQRAAKVVRLLPGVHTNSSSSSSSSLTSTPPTQSSPGQQTENTVHRSPFSVWGPLIVKELEQAPNHTLSMRNFTSRIHALAYEHNLRLPPGGAISWCFIPQDETNTVKNDPYLVRIRPLWSTVNIKKGGPPKIEAVQLVPEGETALQKDIEELQMLAASLR